MVIDEGLTNNNTNEIQHQNSSNPNLSTMRSFVLYFFQAPTPSPTLHTFYD